MRAERECRKHFGECAWRIDEATCVPCMGTLGGRVRLYEAHIVAHASRNSSPHARLASSAATVGARAIIPATTGMASPACWSKTSTLIPPTR